MTGGSKKPPTVSRQCEQLAEALMSIFRASRYVGPRPDVVFRSMVVGGLAERTQAGPAVLDEVAKSLEFKVTGDDREIGWLATNEERKRLLKRIFELTTRRRLGQSTDEWTVSGFRSVTRDENTRRVLKEELEKLWEPLPTELDSGLR